MCVVNQRAYANHHRCYLLRDCLYRRHFGTKFYTYIQQQKVQYYRCSFTWTKHKHYLTLNIPIPTKAKETLVCKHRWQDANNSRTTIAVLVPRPAKGEKYNMWRCPRWTSPDSGYPVSSVALPSHLALFSNTAKSFTYVKNRVCILKFGFLCEDIHKYVLRYAVFLNM